ncbi:phosphoribosylamine--glycine ligase [Microbacterium arborescens]|uniref:phosphoribosylamine--glycine ligase n=1 Tax=Microbacterium arborescens TaxID=33883 RepID=UPI00278120FA|nr:phosphoribosylamine--glycine ligase [Microbacterium arborescens]MDQ1217589.1 phosphoribosylamine--glycine ligase [Microbacterium arborescens]
MKILVLGSGAREHAIILALAAEGAGHDLLAAPGNAGIARDAEIVPGLDQNDPVAVTEFAGSANVDLVIVGPEAPLIAGVADALRERGIPVFGPGKVAAQLEGSKAFAKRVMDEAGVPTGRAVRARSRAEVEAALDELGAPHVVKADGLAAGKGVIVTDDRDAALAHADTYLASGPVLIEEFLAGPEVSLFFVSDGDTVRALSPAQDYKRAYDGDAGPNTGGMGAYSPLPWLADRFGSEAEFVAEVTRDVAEPVIRHLDAEGTPFIGLLYAGLILTESGIKVIEFNARFGDPETQVVLARLTSPLSELLMAAASGRLESEPDPTFSDDAAVTVVLASEGYPENPMTGRALTGLDAAASVEGVHLAHAATAESVDGLVATGGRVLNVVARGTDFAQARDRAYRALAQISLEGSHHRTDIAARVAD